MHAEGVLSSSPGNEGMRTQVSSRRRGLIPGSNRGKHSTYARGPCPAYHSSCASDTQRGATHKEPRAEEPEKRAWYERCNKTRCYDKMDIDLPRMFHTQTETGDTPGTPFKTKPCMAAPSNGTAKARRRRFRKDPDRASFGDVCYACRSRGYGPYR